MSDLKDKPEFQEQPERVHDGQVHVHISHWTDESGQTDAMLFRMEVWPIDELTGARIMQACGKIAMEMLDAEKLTKGEWGQESSGNLPPGATLQ